MNATGKCACSRRPSGATQWIVTLLGLLFVWYVATYAVLSRRGMAEFPAAGFGEEHHAFFYVSVPEMVNGLDRDDDTLYQRHHWRRLFFMPANTVDVSLFGGPIAVRSLTRIG